MNNEYYNNKYNAKESSVIFWEDILEKLSKRDKEIFRILKPNGSFLLNLSPIPYGKDKEILPLPYIGYDIMVANGFKIRNIITWTFNNMQNCTNRLSSDKAGKIRY